MRLQRIVHQYGSLAPGLGGSRRFPSVRRFIAAAFIGLLSIGPVAASWPARRHWAAGQVEIPWDQWGAPHIYAQEDDTAFYAMGWVQAENHADLLLKMFLQARGSSAEFLGVGQPVQGPVIQLSSKHCDYQLQLFVQRCLRPVRSDLAEVKETHALRCVFAVGGSNLFGQI